MTTSTATTQDTIASLVAKAQAAHPDLAARLARAATLVKRVEFAPELDAYWVPGTCEPWYLVIVLPHGPWLCQCKDQQYRGGWCAHVLAAALVRRVSEQQHAARATGLAAATYARERMVA